MTPETTEPTTETPATVPVTTPEYVLLDREHEITAFASNDARRCVINSVHLDKRGFLEATNGRQLIRVPCVRDGAKFPPISGSPEPIVETILPSDKFKKAVSGIPKSKLTILNNLVLVSGGDGKARMVTNDLDTENSVVTKTIEENYPDTDQVIPKTTEVTFSIALSPDELGIIVDYCRKHCGDKSRSIKFEFASNLEPVRWQARTEKGKDVTGVLMPMRMS